MMKLEFGGKSMRVSTRRPSVCDPHAKRPVISIQNDVFIGKYWLVSIRASRQDVLGFDFANTALIFGLCLAVSAEAFNKIKAVMASDVLMACIF